MKGLRKIVVDGKVWWWKLIKSKVLIFDDETKTKRVVRLTDLSGLSPNDIERGMWKRWFKVTPKDISEWIKGR